MASFGTEVILGCNFFKLVRMYDVYEELAWGWPFLFQRDFNQTVPWRCRAKCITRAGVGTAIGSGRRQRKEKTHLPPPPELCAAAFEG